MDAGEVLLYLAGISLRALAIGGLAYAAIAVFRVRSAAGRHAVWTFALLGVLALMALNPLLPSLPVPVGSAQPVPAAPERATSSASLTVQPGLAQPPVTSRWKQALLAAYAAGCLFFLAQLCIGYGLTSRLAKRSRRLSVASAAAGVFESSEISVPIAVGVWHPRILLPGAWSTWDATKLRSVLAHEEAHVQRADWAILLTAAFTRCLLWFHPLTWWIERRLAALAELACDDRALLETGDREAYAQALLDMAQSVRSKQGRLLWAGIAMAKETQVKTRIDQILDETRPITGTLSRGRWLTLCALSLPLVYLLASLQPVRAQAQTRNSEWLQQVSHIITAPEIAAFNNLKSDSDRDRFIEQFWEQRNPTPGAGTNPYKDEFYRRVTYANDHYSTDIPGWKTDRGRIYLQHGPPDEIESHPASTPPFEDWRFHHLDGMGDNVDFRFVDRDGNNSYSLNAPGPVIQQSGFAVTNTPQRIRVGANVQAANLITKIDPVYPPLAQQARIQGVVRFTAIIGKDGHISNLQLVSGHPLLVQPAQEALARWTYRPTLLNGEPVEVVTQVDVKFALPPSP